MSKIIDEIKKLKESLSRTGKTYQFTPDLNDISLSQQIFVNPDLLPKNVELSKRYASKEQVEDYSNKVLQASYVIADCAASGYISAAYYSSYISNSFDFLDVHTRAPKIINDQTYKVGSKLRDFLKRSLTQESLNEIPLEVLREKVKTTLERIFAVLENRLSNYEAHQPEQLQEAEEALTQKAKRLSLLDAKEKQYKEHQLKLAQRIEPIEEFISKPLSLNKDETHQNILELIKIKEEHQKLTDEFKQFCDHWHQENLQLNLDKTITVSHLIEARVTQNQEQIISEALNLYNTSNKIVWTENVLESLNKAMDKAIAPSMSDDSRIFKLLMLEQYAQLLEERQQDEQLLQDFDSQQRTMISEIHAEKLSEWIVSLTNNEDHSWPKALKEYDTLVQALQHESTKLMTEQVKLEKQMKEVGDSLGRLKIIDNLHESEFKKIRDRSIQALTEKQLTITNNLSVIHQVIELTKSKKHQLESEISQKDQKFRQEKIQELNQKIKVAFINRQQASQNQSKAYAPLNRYEFDVYQPGMQKINDELDPDIRFLSEHLDALNQGIKEKDTQLINLNQLAQERIIFLGKAKTELIKFKEILLQTSGIYVPADKIPQNQLESFLECQGSILETIQSIYKKKESAATWYGFNWTNLSNQVGHFTTFMGKSEFDFDLDDVIDYIDMKLELIEHELQVKITEESPKIVKINNNLVKKQTLWDIQSSYLSTEGLLKDSKTSARALEEQKAEKTKQRDELFDEISQRKASFEKKFKEKSVEHQCSVLEHQLAMASAYTRQLEFKIADFGNGYQHLQKLLASLKNQASHEQALNDLQQEKNTIETVDIDGLMSAKASFRDKSGRELIEEINKHLSTIKEDLGQLKKGLEFISDETTQINLKERISDLDSEFNNLVKAKDALEHSLGELRTHISLVKKEINHEKIVLEEIQSLSAMKSSREEFYQQITQNVGEAVETDAIILKIENYQKKNSLAEPVFTNPNDEKVKEASHAVIEINKKILETYNKLKVEHIKNAMQQLKTRRVPTLDLDQTLQLHKDVSEFLDTQSRFIEDHKDWVDEKVWQEMKAFESQLVEDMKRKESINSQLDVLYKQYFMGQNGSGGLFGEYLAERKRTFWFKDILREIAAFAFGCFGYKTDSQVREEYINDLRVTLMEYKNHSFDMNSVDVLSRVTQGLSQLSPRAALGNPDYDHSLHKKLSEFRDEFEHITSPKLEEDSIQESTNTCSL